MKTGDLEVIKDSEELNEVNLSEISGGEDSDDDDCACECWIGNKNIY